MPSFLTNMFLRAHVLLVLEERVREALASLQSAYSKYGITLNDWTNALSFLTHSELETLYEHCHIFQYPATDGEELRLLSNWIDDFELGESPSRYMRLIVANARSAAAVAKDKYKQSQIQTLTNQIQGAMALLYNHRVYTMTALYDWISNHYEILFNQLCVQNANEWDDPLEKLEIERQRTEGSDLNPFIVLMIKIFQEPLITDEMWDDWGENGQDDDDTGDMTVDAGEGYHW